MSYPPRVEIPFGYYHVATRGNNKRSIYANASDRRIFLTILSRVCRKYGWQIRAYCLMGNHYHLVVQIAEAGLAAGMCRLNTAYAITYNGRHHRCNHLFGRRYWSDVIEDDDHLLSVVRYVVQNPVRSSFADSCEEWEWSSYRATIGTAPAPSFLAVAELMEAIGGNPQTRVSRFRDLCDTPVPPSHDQGRQGR
jgi:REP element-mobilizing transposase RayT